MITSTDFNPRSPHGERPGRFVAAIYEFVISIHAPRTGSDNQARAHARKGKISIHAPRTGSDDDIMHYLQANIAFQSTLPARGATADRILSNMRQIISIHAPRTGSDQYYSSVFAPYYYFNPRSPHGERLAVDWIAVGK